MSRPGGNRSGRHTAPRRPLRCSEEAFALMDQCAEAQIECWSDWARGVLALAVATELKLDEAETIALFDRLEG